MGFDKKRFKGPLVSHFFCFICENVFCEPVETSTCHHVFCKECIAMWLKMEHICPKDGHPLAESDLKPVSSLINSILEDLEISCDNSFYGCKEFVKLRQLAAHSKECHFNPNLVVICGRKCGATFRRGNFEGHSCIAYLMEENSKLRHVLSGNETMVNELMAEKMVKDDVINTLMNENKRIQEKDREVKRLLAEKRRLNQTIKCQTKEIKCIKELAKSFPPGSEEVIPIPGESLATDKVEGPEPTEQGEESTSAPPDESAKSEASVFFGTVSEPECVLREDESKIMCESSGDFEEDSMDFEDKSSDDPNDDEEAETQERGTEEKESQVIPKIGGNSSSSCFTFSVNIPEECKAIESFNSSILCKGCLKTFPCHYVAQTSLLPSPAFFIHCTQFCDKYKALGLTRKCFYCKQLFISEEAYATHNEAKKCGSSGSSRKKPKWMTDKMFMRIKHHSTINSTISCRGCKREFGCFEGKKKRKYPSFEYFVHCIESCPNYTYLGLVKECVHCKCRFIDNYSYGKHIRRCSPSVPVTLAGDTHLPPLLHNDPTINRVTSSLCGLQMSNVADKREEGQENSCNNRAR